MLTINDFNRLIGRIKSKLMLMVGRAVLAVVDNSGGTQKIQVVALYDETISGVERFQEYGMETRPKAGAEVLLAFINGNRDQGIAACVHDRRYRPKDLAEGEVVLYTLEDVGGKDHRIHFKVGKKIEAVGTDIKIGLTSGHKAAVLETLIAAFNSHTHSTPAGLSGTPTTPLVKADHVSQETKLT